MPALKTADIKDKSIQAALKAALAGDRRITADEAYEIINAALDGKGITKQERQDLRVLFSRSQSVDAAVKADILKWLDRCDRLSVRLRYADVSRNYGDVPPGWRGSVYDTGGGGSCAVRLCKALKAAGMNFANYKFKYMWKKELPVNAGEVSKFLTARFGEGEKFSRKGADMSVRQGIVFIDGQWTADHGLPVGHVTLWNGDDCEDGTNYDVKKGAEKCRFWELRPDWLLG